MQSGSNGVKDKYKLVWGKYVNDRTFSGVGYPKVGEVIDIPDFGKCKIERLAPLIGSSISRNSPIRVIISWKSIGNKTWWEDHINSPAHYGWQALKINENDLKIFSDIEIPNPKEVKVKKDNAKKVRFWGEETNSVFDPRKW